MQENNVPDIPFSLFAEKARLTVTGDGELLSAGMAGIVPVCFTFSEDWDGLEKTAVFSNGTRTVKVSESLWDENTCLVPQEVLETAGKTVMAGVYGTNGLHLVLPTVWCVLGRVEASVDLTGDPVSPAYGINAMLQRLEALENAVVTEDTVSGWGFTKNALTQHQSLAGMVPRDQQAIKTGDMTQAVGIDSAGKLWAMPGGLAKILAFTESSGNYTYYGANFSFSAIGDIMQMAENGESVRIAVINTGDVYALSHMQGANALARLYFIGFTWGTGMTKPTVDVYALDDQMQLTKTSTTDLEAMGTYSKPIGGIPFTDLSTAVQNKLDSVFAVTLTENAGVVSSDKTIAQIYAAVQAGKAIPVIYAGNCCGWVGYASASECALFCLIAHDSPPQLCMVYMDANSTYLDTRQLEVAPAEFSLTGATQSIAAQNNAIYKCGVLTALSVTSFPNSGDFIVRFSSGSTPTSLTVPQTLHMPDGFSVATNTRYEISVSDGYAVVASWAVSA